MSVDLLACKRTPVGQNSDNADITSSIARKKLRQDSSKGKVMLELFFDSNGIVHMEFIPQGATVNKTRYKEILGHLRDSIYRKRPELWRRKNVLLLHDNTLAHRSILVLQNLTDPDISEAYGYSLSEELPNLSALAFADDLALISFSEKHAISLVNQAECSLATIGLHINPDKSKYIILRKGHLSSGQIVFLQGSAISSLENKKEQIRYLGVDFNDEICFDKRKVFSSLASDLHSLTQSQLLKTEQKIKIINEYGQDWCIPSSNPDL
ncbi:hypothetical protein ANN_11093 [Periplaneta americana]|uniref:Reverse transcriptase domain-containing protein n=1 Tax=Periplaneta americana TaxID=6978 RepID=A0ABQ8T5Q9_PERAM|nr:hypothetical protein ANN_11093 [Periplaneta americana]